MQLIEVFVIDSALVIDTVGHVKVIIDMIIQPAGIYGRYATIDLIKDIRAIPGSICESKKAVIFFQVILIDQQVVQGRQPFTTQ
jgi:hypothetical protein